MHDSSFIDARYQVLRTIGSGGMGVVYLVVDTRRSNQILALKLLRNVEDEAALENFRAEFRTMRGVVHPHIPSVFDFGALTGFKNGYYFTSEFVDGKPLSQITPVWTPEQLRSALVCLCRALAFLHSRGLLHRDIKPDNVLARLNSQGEFTLLKLVDFGLASRVNSAEVTGETGGTLDFMAPELFSSGQASVATDLYALGVLMYRLAVGRMPFTDEEALAGARSRTKREMPNPLRFRPDLPVGLADVILSLIQANPADRPASARHTIALLNERDGTNFDYESPETRRSYISSSGSVTNIEAREVLAELRDSLKNKVQPDNLLIRARAGLGRTRMLKEFAVELTLAGFKTRVVTQLREIPPKSQCGDVLLIPDAEALPLNRISELLAAPECRDCVWIVAGAFSQGVPEPFARWRQISLQPLAEAGVAEFIKSTFPDSNFPPDFVRKMLGHTLGYPSALEAALDELVKSERLRIGLFGWELLPGRWSLPVHRHIEELVRDALRELPECARTFLNTLACSLRPVPHSVAIGLFSSEPAVFPDILIRNIAEMGWIHESPQGLNICRDAIKLLLHAKLSTEERRAAHAMLYRLWSSADDADEESKTEALLFHDFLSGAFKTPPERAGELLEGALLRGRTAWVRKLLEESRALVPPSHRNIVLISSSRLEYIEGDLTKAVELLGGLVDQGNAPPTPENLIYLSRYAALLEKLGESDRAESILRNCRSLVGDSCRDAAGPVFGTLAWIHFKRGDGEQARELAEEGLVRVRQDSNDAGFALLLNTVGALAFYRGDSDVARTYWHRCLEVLEGLGDKRGVANMYNNLGVLAAQSGDRLRARSLWERCAEISKEIDDVHRLAGIYNNLGVDALETGALREAEEYYLKSLALFRKLENTREQVETLSNLGELAYHRADYTRAQAYLKEAVKLAEAIGDQESQLEPMIYMGKLLSTLEALEDAENVLTEAQRLSSSLGTRKSEGQAWEGLASLFARRGEHDKAIEAVERAQVLMANEADPLALINLHLTHCRIAAESGHDEDVRARLEAARKVAEIKWDPYSAARTQMIAVFYAGEKLEGSDKQVALRKVSVYPYLAWRFHWGLARQHAAEGQLKRALEEFGKAISILKSIAAKLPEEQQDVYLKAPQILRFKEEVVALRTAMKKDD